MSASLVGSDMCIRDRGTCREGLGGGAPRRGRAQPVAWGPLGRPAGTPLTCLLYTSDAADDM
eukprot:7617225-Alexandrium_andersonii.AAC.1